MADTLDTVNVTTGRANSGAVGARFKSTPVAPAVRQLKLPETMLKDIAGYYSEQLNAAHAARGEMERRWQEWDRQWEAMPRLAQKDFPWKGASNLELPLAAIIGMTIYSRLLNTLFAYEPFFVMKTEIKDLIEDVKGLEEFLEAVKETELKLFDNISSLLMTTVRMGTGFLKTTYERQKSKFWTYDEDGGLVEKEFTNYDGPCIRPVAIENFIVPRFNVESIQDQPWVAERHPLDRAQMIDLGARLGFDTEELLRVGPSTLTDEGARNESRDRHEGVSQSSAGQSETWPNDIYEIWGRYDINGDRREEDIVVFMGKDSAKPLGVYGMWYFDKKRPYTKFVYERREHRFYGVGVGSMLERLQDAISTVHNQRIDNATLANTRVWVARRSSGLKPGESVWPGRTIMANNPREDIVALQAGEVYPSSVANETNLRDYVERRTAVSEFSMGRESPIMGTRATATSTLSIMAEGNKRFDLAMKEVRDSLGEVAVQILSRYHQYKPTGKIYYIIGANSEKVQRVLNFPPDFVTELINVQVSASTAAVNKEIEKQNRITLFTLLSQFYDKMFTLIKLVNDPMSAQMPGLRELAGHAGRAGVKLSETILKDFDIKNPDAYLPTIEALVGMFQQQAQPQADPMAAIAQGGMNVGGQVDPQNSGGGIPGPGAADGLPPELAGAFGVS